MGGPEARGPGVRCVDLGGPARKRLRLAAVGFGAIAALTVVLAGGAVEAAEIRVFSANGVKAVMADLVPRFESTSGHKLIVTYGEAGELRRRILEVGDFDLAVLPAQTLRDMATLGKIAAGSMIDIASSDVGMAVRTGGNKPDTSSAGAFKRSLLAAEGIIVSGSRVRELDRVRWKARKR